jgi:hypothetical protein
MGEHEMTRFELVIRKLQDNPWAAAIVVGAVILSAAVGLVGDTFDLWERIRGRVPPAQTVQAPASAAGSEDEVRARVAGESKSFSPVSFEEYVHNAMTYIRSDQTDLQREAYVESMDGKKVIWTAPVLGVKKLWDGAVSLTLEHDGRFAWFNFDSSYMADLMALKPGDIVQVTGVIGGWEGTYVELNDSRILRVLGNAYSKSKESKSAGTAPRN